MCVSCASSVGGVFSLVPSSVLSVVCLCLFCLSCLSCAPPPPSSHGSGSSQHEPRQLHLLHLSGAALGPGHRPVWTQLLHELPDEPLGPAGLVQLPPVQGLVQSQTQTGQEHAAGGDAAETGLRPAEPGPLGSSSVRELRAPHLRCVLRPV